MGINNKVSTNIEISKTELEAKMSTRLDEFKYYTVRSLDKKISAITKNLLLILLNGHFSIHVKDLHMYYNSPKIHLS